MTAFIGSWKLENTLYCRKEVSGHIFSAHIDKIPVYFCFPYCPEEYNPDSNSVTPGDLLPPYGAFSKECNWGIIREWPAGLFEVFVLGCYAYKNEADIQRIYNAFPACKEKFQKLQLILSGKYMVPKQPELHLVQYGGVNDGLMIYTVENKIARYVRNFRPLDPYLASLPADDDCLGINEIKNLFNHASSDAPIALHYELLATAYQAVYHHDFRSAVIIAGTALEKSILLKIAMHYQSQNLPSFDQDKQKHRMLGKKFEWLQELGITIPVNNHKSEILDIRNSTTHEGICHDYHTTMKFLRNCTTIIQLYTPNPLEQI